MGNKNMLFRGVMGLWANFSHGPTIFAHGFLRPVSQAGPTHVKNERSTSNVQVSEDVRHTMMYSIFLKKAE
jgi:hypothetical protein